MKETQEKPTGLPENAFRPLKPGEKYEPLMSPGKTYPEVNFWSVTWGLVMAVIFSAAAAYLGLKVGQVFEAAIPIAIIAVGISSATKRKGALGENVMIQSIGACSGVIVAGAIFTLPALYILQEKYPEMCCPYPTVIGRRSRKRGNGGSLSFRQNGGVASCEWRASYKRMWRSQKRINDIPVKRVIVP